MDSTHTFDGSSTSGSHRINREPIAIVGMGMRLPGNVNTSEQFWDLLMNKKCTSREVPSSRYDINGFWDGHNSPGTVKSRFGHFLDCDIDKVDTSFFSITTKEVDKIDPQQRLLLEVVWECMESGGQRGWRGRNIGCYVGSFGEDWLDLAGKDPQNVGRHRLLGYGDFVSSNRVSYEFDLKGPSMTIRTACSSSLIGLHEACNAIFSGQCESAIVAGTALHLTPTMTIWLTESGVQSPTGSCKSFDANADGYTRGEAINAIYIKKLSDAVRDGDPIRAVLRGTAAGFDGKTKGMPNPSPESQEALIRAAYRDAGIEDVNQTGFFECHGTGTKVGDPIETGAVGKVFGEKGIYITSVKPNVGHSEGAAGLTSLIKAVLSLEHETIPPNVHFSKGNPKIKWEKHKLRVPTEATPWPKDRLGRVSVNCFGIGGANAHAIVDSVKQYLAPQSITFTPPFSLPSERLLVFSAHHADSLKEQSGKLLKYAQTRSGQLDDLTYTLATHRERLQCRSFAIADGSWPLETSPVVKAKSKPLLNFVFTGQGAQWAGMGADLIDKYPVFGDTIRELDSELRTLQDGPSWTIEAELRKPSEDSNIMQPMFSQPLCIALQIALVNLLASWNVKPAAVVGHSSGEVAAAYACGSLTQREAIITAYYRGLVAQTRGRVGGMAAVGLGQADVTPYLKKGVVLACENSPKSVTLSGDVDRLDEVVAAIKADKPDTFARRLKVERAWHSHHMKEIGAAYQKRLEGHVRFSVPSVPFFSSVTSWKVDNKRGDLGPAYWRENLESPVQFASAVELMLTSNTESSLLLEIGPHSALSGPIRDIVQAMELTEVEGAPPYVATLKRNEDGVKSLLTTLGRLFQEDADFDVSAITPGKKILTDLPTYSWLHEKSQWNESRVMRNWRLREHSYHELLGLRLLESDDLEPAWRSMLRLENVPWARDHKIQEDTILPGAAYITMAVEAVNQITTEDYDGVSFRQVDIKTAMILQEGEPVEVVTHLRPVRLTASLNSAWYEFSISSCQNNSWVRHCVGQVKAGKDGNMPLEDISSQTRKVSSQAWYSALEKVGYNYGTMFQGLSDITARPGSFQASARIVNEDRDSKAQYKVHPSIIDFGLQMFTVALSEGLSRRLSDLSIPTYIDRLYVGAAAPGMAIGAHAQASGAGAIKGSSTIMADGQIVLNMRDVDFTPLGTGENKNEVIPAAQLHWKPDIDFISPIELIRPVGGARDATEKLDKLALFCVLEMLERVENIETTTYLTNFRQWMRAHREQALAGKLELPGSSEIATLDRETRLAGLESLKRELQASAAAEPGRAITRLVDSAEEIFQGGEIKARQVLNMEEGLESLYSFLNLRCDYGPYLSLLGHKIPTMKILEIGSGAPSMIAEMLRGLIADDGEATFQRYVYSDATPDTFAILQERLKDNKNVEFKTLDVSKDFTEQGFDADSFDLVVFSNVLHPGTTLQETLRRIRHVTKPNGRLLTTVFSSRYKSLKFITGFLPGGSEELSLTKEEWDQELRDAGFSGTDAFIHDDVQSYKVNAHIVSTAVTLKPPTPSITLLIGEQKSVVDELQHRLTQKGYKVSLSTLNDDPPIEGDIISLLDLDRPFFQTMKAQDLVKMQSYLGKVGSQGLLWVTGLAQVNCTQPEYAATIGVLRTIRTEMSLAFASVETNLANPDLEKIIAVFEHFRVRAPGGDLDPDWEYAIVEGNVLVPRYEWIDMSQGRREAIGDGARTLEIGRLGQIKSLQWAENDLGPLKSDEVEIEPRAVGMNVQDILVAMRVVNGHRPGFGIECAGVVRNIGSNVKDFARGDRVMAFGHGCFTTSLHCSADLVAKIPQGLDYAQAATIPAVYSTAIQALLNLGDLDDSQTVLIHSACGGVGLAALNISKMLGAEVFATVGTEEKVKYLMDNYDIPRDHIFSSRDTSFYDDLMAATNNRGADIVLNSLKGELLHTSWKCVARFGKMLEIGKQDVVGHAKLGMGNFEANRTFCGIDMSLMACERPKACRKVLKQCLQLFGEGGVKPIEPVKTFPATKIVDAFKFMSEGKHLGKVLVTMPEDPTELQLASKAQDVRFKSDASYVLIGGLGGLGCAVSTWMVENGARHLLFMSRRAGETEREKLFIRELESQGCQVQLYKGNVAKLEDVQNMVASAGCPVAGVLHMPMVLKDHTLLQLSHEDWFAAVQPKVDGAKNLHSALEGSNLDFFIMFSSISYVVGQAGQANYAAANAYLAAFAQYRHSLGLPASVLNVAVMGDVGYVVENQSVLDVFKAMSFHICKETDLLDSLTFQMTTQRPATPAPGTFVNTAELALGLKSTKPLGDRQNRAPWRRDARMAAAHLKDPASAQGASNEDISSFLSGISADPTLLDKPDSLEFLTRQIGECIYNLMSKPLDEMDEKASLASLGVDSLITIEILNWWRHTLGLSSSVLEIMSAGSIGKLGGMAARMLKETHMVSGKA